MMNGAGWDMGFGGSLWMTLVFVAGIAIVAGLRLAGGVGREQPAWLNHR